MLRSHLLMSAPLQCNPDSGRDCKRGCAEQITVAILTIGYPCANARRCPIGDRGSIVGESRHAIPCCIAGITSLRYTITFRNFRA